jgi:hypothetical protein
MRTDSQHQLTPKEAPRLRRRVEFDISSYLPHGLNRFSARHISSQEYVEIIKAGLSKTLVQIQDLICRRFGAFDLPVCSVIAWDSLIAPSSEPQR